MTSTRLPRRLALVAFAVTLFLVVSACGSSGGGSSSSGGGSPSSAGAGQPGKGKPSVTIGDKNFTEEMILGELYAQALRAKGYTVNLKSDIGSTELIYKALQSGQIGLYPEYTGVIVTIIAQKPNLPATAQATYQEAKSYLASNGFGLLDATPFSDRETLNVTSAFAQQHHLAAIGDLKALGASVTYGAPPELKVRHEGLLGLRQVYGLMQMRYAALNHGLIVPSLDAGKIQVGDVLSTDGVLLGNKYLTLSDPKNLFGFQNAAPIVSAKLLRQEGPAFASTVNAVSAKLTTKAMQQLNAAVDIQKVDPKTVAAKFLQANGL